MNKWMDRFEVMKMGQHQFVTTAHEQDKVIVFEKGDLLFVFNFHPTKSFENYKVGTQWDSDHVLLFESDSKEFGGHDRLSAARGKRFVRHNESHCGRKMHIKIYLPNRSVLVFLAEQNFDERADNLVAEPVADAKDIKEIAATVTALELESLEEASAYASEDASEERAPEEVKVLKVEPAKTAEAEEDDEDEQPKYTSFM